LLASVPTLRHIVGDAGNDDAWEPRHTLSISPEQNSKTGDRPRFCVRLAKNERSRKRILMPRHARIVAAGFPLHAILRGIDRSAIFFDDADYRALLGMLVERAAAESVWVHA
jgi:hypothetical protein